MLQQDIKWNKS